MEFFERKRWLFFGLPFTFTTYTVKEEMITVDTGFFKKEENDCYMYKIVDVKLVESFWERIFKIGTISCYTSDTTDPHLTITHVKNAKAIKNFILEQSEKERLKRRTLNTQHIGHIMEDANGDGIPDDI